MRKRHTLTVLFTATLAVVLAVVPLRHLALTPAQAQQAPTQQEEAQRLQAQQDEMMRKLGITFEDAPPPKNPLPTLKLTGYQAKAIMQAVETFIAEARELSPGVPTDLTRYRLRLIHQKFNDLFSGIFERDGVPVATPRILASGSDDPGITIDGDELKALLVVTQAIRDTKHKLPKQQQYHFDYDITNYDVQIQRDNKDKDLIHVSCDAHMFGVYWPQISDKSDKKPAELAGSWLQDQGGFWQFEVSRKTYKIGTIYFTGI